MILRSFTLWWNARVWTLETYVLRVYWKLESRKHISFPSISGILSTSPRISSTLLTLFWLEADIKILKGFNTEFVRLLAAFPRSPKTVEEQPDYADRHRPGGRFWLSVNVRANHWSWRTHGGFKSTEWGVMSLFDRNKPRLLKNPSSEANLPELSEQVWLPLWSLDLSPVSSASFIHI